MNRTEEHFLGLINSTGAVHEGHFVLVSGRHTGHYVSKDAVSSHPHILSQLAKGIADQFQDSGVQVVAAPAVGAIGLGNWVAYHLGPEVRSVYLERAVSGTEGLRLDRGYAALIDPETKVLLAEDIITTGKTTRWMMEAISGEVVGVGLLWNRNPDELGLGVPVHALVTQVPPTYLEEECPLCREEKEIVTGVNKHGSEFLEANGKDPSGWPANQAA